MRVRPGEILERPIASDHPGRIFISYLRKEGKYFAADPRKLLEGEAARVWHDLVALDGRGYRWSQFEDALKSKGAAAFHPRRHAGAKTVCSVKGPDLGDLDKLPRRLDHA